MGNFLYGGRASEPGWICLPCLCRAHADLVKPDSLVLTSAFRQCAMYSALGLAAVNQWMREG